MFTSGKFMKISDLLVYADGLECDEISHRNILSAAADVKRESRCQISPRRSARGQENLPH